VLVDSQEMIRTFVVAAVLLLQVATATERVTITTPDGSTLAARYFDAGSGAPGVLFFPMCSPGATEGWTPVAERLRTAGVSSLITSYRGSPGNTTGNGQGNQRGPDSDAALAYLRSRVGTDAPVAFAGSSCGVSLALRTAAASPKGTRAVVALSGPHTQEQMDYVRTTPALAVFSGASAAEPPSPEWARALDEGSAHPASRAVILEQRAHGTDLFGVHPTLATDIADWLVTQLKAPPRG
jgi:predicted alpha/beta hydrolase